MNGDDIIDRRVLAAIGDGAIEDKAIRLMVWVGARMDSTTRHNHLTDPYEIVRSGRAWCDQHTRVFVWFAWKFLGCAGRNIALKHSDGVNGHSVAELYYARAWHLFDVHPDHQMIYRAADGHIMSHAELMERPSVIVEKGHWWRGSNGEGKAGFYCQPPKRIFDLSREFAGQP